MKAKNLHLQFHPEKDRAMLVDHGHQPLLAYDVHNEFMFCVASWGLRGATRPRELNIVEKLLRKLGIRVAQASAVRTIETKSGTFRVRVEHLT